VSAIGGVSRSTKNRKRGNGRETHLNLFLLPVPPLPSIKTHRDEKQPCNKYALSTNERRRHEEKGTTSCTVEKKKWVSLEIGALDAERLGVGKIGLHDSLEDCLRDVHLWEDKGENGKKGEETRETNGDERVGDLGKSVAADELEELVSDGGRVL
jgi:hypothetical protein